jgi:hypothetical protein
MAIQVDGKPIRTKWIMEWVADIAATVIVSMIVWAIFAPASGSATTGDMGVAVALTALAAYGSLKLFRNLVWIDK